MNKKDFARMLHELLDDYFGYKFTLIDEKNPIVQMNLEDFMNWLNSRE